MTRSTWGTCVDSCTGETSASHWGVTFSVLNCKAHMRLMALAYSRCTGEEFRAYVYPLQRGFVFPVAGTGIWKSLMESPYYTSDATLACVFVHIQHSFLMPNDLESLEYWGNDGQNHVVIFTDRGQRFIRNLQRYGNNTAAATFVSTLHIPG